MFSHKDTEARRREEGSRRGAEAQEKSGEEREEHPPIAPITPIGETKTERHRADREEKKLTQSR